MRRVLLLSVGATAIVVAAACGRQDADLPFGSSPTGSSTTPPLSPTPTPFAGNGNGQDGSPTLAGNLTINTCQTVTLGQGTSLDVVASAGLAPGRLVLIIQAQAPMGAAFGDTSMRTSIGEAGTWQLSRIVSAGSSSTLSVEPALAHTYLTSSTASQAQVCTVPEYGSPTITGTITAPPWNGQNGGVLAFMATGTISLTGNLDATAAGFQGGAPSANATSTPADTDLNTPSDLGGGKGEGLQFRGANKWGRGNLTNGGGGGNSFNGGGGGGGNGGQGGIGGAASNGTTSGDGDPATAGMPGAAIRVPGALVFGGGGGGGQQNDTLAGVGGQGGGIVFLRAAALDGNGKIHADGASGGTSGNPLGTSSADGGGGGGAGGTIVLETPGGGFTGHVTAIGGAGGDVNQLSTNSFRGPGGGGGGGYVFAGFGPGASISVAPGPNGLLNEDNGGLVVGSTPHGAAPGASGVIDTSGNFVAP